MQTLLAVVAVLVNGVVGGASVDAVVAISRIDGIIAKARVHGVRAQPGDEVVIGSHTTARGVVDVVVAAAGGEQHALEAGHGDAVDDLVAGRVEVIGELHLHHRPQPVGRHADGAADDAKAPADGGDDIVIVDDDGGAATLVAQPVDKDPTVAGGLAQIGGVALGSAVSEPLSRSLGECFHDRPVPVVSDRCHHMDAFAAGE